MPPVPGRSPVVRLPAIVLYLTTAGEVKKRALILISTDKGLCGALNTNLLREASKASSANTVYVVAGRKGAQWVARLKRELVAEFTYKDSPQFSEARAISKFAQELFLSGQVDAVDIVFTNYINTLTQKPEVRSLLPMGRLQKLEADLRGTGNGGELEAPGGPEYSFEPGAPQLLGILLPQRA